MDFLNFLNSVQRFVLNRVTTRSVYDVFLGASQKYAQCHMVGVHPISLEILSFFLLLIPL